MKTGHQHGASVAKSTHETNAQNFGNCEESSLLVMPPSSDLMKLDWLNYRSHHRPSMHQYCKLLSVAKNQ